MPRVLVVQHEDGCPVDLVGGWLAQEGAVVEVLRPYAGDVVPPAVGADGLVVLGGSMGSDDDAAFPWLTPVKGLLATAVGAGVPTLGICLGAQLLASACGGRVEVGSLGIEAGVVDVAWRPEAAQDRLVSGLPAPFPAASMHFDTVVQLPPGATWLGEGTTYAHQVFRVGEAAWGVQFHPEASLATYRGWAAAHADDWPRWDLDGDRVVGQLADRQDEVTAAGRALTARFAAVLRSG